MELLADVAPFIPPVFVAALVSLRPLLVLAAGSGAVGAVQALVPASGRAGGTDDWSTNTLGAVVGILLAAGTTTLADRVATCGTATRRSRAVPAGASARWLCSSGA